MFPSLDNDPVSLKCVQFDRANKNEDKCAAVPRCNRDNRVRRSSGRVCCRTFCLRLLIRLVGGTTGLKLPLWRAAALHAAVSSLSLQTRIFPVFETFDGGS